MNYDPASQGMFEANMRLRDLEEKNRLLTERTALIAKTLVDEKERTFSTIQELKKSTLLLKEENLRLKEFVQRLSEQISNTARREELLILQRQLDLFRQ